PAVPELSQRHDPRPHRILRQVQRRRSGPGPPLHGAPAPGLQLGLRRRLPLALPPLFLLRRHRLALQKSKTRQSPRRSPLIFMPSLHQITPPLAPSYKAVRLRALQDTPSAFGSTYYRESQFSDADWQQRAANLCTPRSIGYLACEQDEYCGIAVGFLNEQNPQIAELMSMWVAPAT